MRKYRKFQDELRDDPEQAYAYVQVALEESDRDSDTEHLILVLRNVAEAQGRVPELARQVNMGKTNLYRALSEKGNPTLSTVNTILHGLGYRLALAPSVLNNALTEDQHAR